MPSYSPAVSRWLLLCLVGIFLLVLLGGTVRLTHSGLSMTQWHPVTGVVPPLDDRAWEEEFTRYQATPEFQKVRRDMTLGNFKFIYWMEYSHRLLGRLVGLIFAVPFFFFLLTRKVGGTLAKHLWLALVLGGLQGLLGWFMVKSGLVDIPRVSPYRLTAHLMLAVFLFSYLLVLRDGLRHGLTTIEGGQVKKDSHHRIQLRRLIAFLFLMMASGALVAGTRAGFSYNTFPLMRGQLIPDGALSLSPIWRNLFENVATVQFTHRVLALVVLVWSLMLGVGLLKSAISPSVCRMARWMMALVVIQVALGISTLLSGVMIPLAVMHQGTALLLLAAMILLERRLSRDVPPDG